MGKKSLQVEGKLEVLLNDEVNQARVDLVTVPSVLEAYKIYGV